MLTAILLLLVLVPLVVLAVRCVLMIVRLLGAEREAPSHSSEVVTESREERAAVKVAPDASRVCMVCGEQVLATARMCRHCGAALSS